jgi:simple sugar transport system substrate-binding protein
VVAFNVTASTGPVLDCLLSFVGQDFEQAGALIAQRMIDDDLIRSGDEVACPVEDPSAVYAIQRAAGVNSALEAVGAECDVVATGFDLAEAQTALQQYLLGRSNTQAIVALGLVPLQVAPAAAQAAGVDVEIGGFDLSSEISEAIESGDITAAVNQQPYLQGYYAVTQLALRLKYGLTPSDIDTGNALVDSTNVAEVSELAGSVY